MGDHALFDQLAGLGQQRGGIEGHLDGAVGVQPLRHLAAQDAGHQGLRHFDEDVVKLELALAPDLQDVAEAGGRDQAPSGRLCVRSARC